MNLATNDPAAKLREEAKRATVIPAMDPFDAVFHKCPVRLLPEIEKKL
jgi:hypothetical protein